ncbi:MAG: PEP-CTERM sorting domain-containing protein [Gemmataceae bacterium]
MFAHFRYLSCLTLLAMAPGLSHAQTTLQVYEPFSYVAGANLNGQNGGVGFNLGGASWVENSLTAKVSASGLAFGQLATTGLGVRVNSEGFQAATRDMAIEPITNSNVFWLSFLIQRTANTSTSSFISGEYAGITIGGDLNTGKRTFIGAGPTASAGTQFVAGQNGNSASDVYDTSGGAIPVATSSTNNVALIVAKVNTLSGLVNVFVNPGTLGTGTGPSTPSFSYTNGSFVNGKTLAIVYGGGADYSIDDLRIGQTFIDVTPVPEPATIVALSAMTIGGMWIRKRKQQKAANRQPILAV